MAFVDSLNNFIGDNQAEISRQVRRYLPVAQLLTGVFLVFLGYAIGKDHLHLLRQGARAPGRIVDYKRETFRNSARSSTSTGFMPIVQFRDGDRLIQFKDWLGSGSVGFLGKPVTVLYDPTNPSAAMIDRPVWNWIPWGPTLAIGIFLICVGLLATAKSLKQAQTET
jgi:hypothetical protein